jgi:hypothetical protein
MIEYVSKCCGKPLKVEGEGSTHWYSCTGCGNGTDPVEKTEDKQKESK